MAKASRYDKICVCCRAITNVEAAKTLTTIRCMTSPLDLEDRYREDIAFIPHRARTQSIPRSSNGRQYSYTLACVHGAGGGSLPGGMVNRADRFMQAMDGVDVFIHGHSHKPYCLW